MVNLKLTLDILGFVIMCGNYFLLFKNEAILKKSVGN